MSRENSDIVIEAFEQQDLPAALNVQADTYPLHLIEEAQVFLNRINLAASYCLTAKQGKELAGYLLAHGWSSQSPPPLGTVLAEGVPSEVLFIHDLAVSPLNRGLRVGERLVTRAFELGAQAGLRRAELIAVEGAAHYWRRLGFAEGPISGGLLGKIGTYGAHARWMTREIPQTV